LPLDTGCGLAMSRSSSPFSFPLLLFNEVASVERVNIGVARVRAAQGRTVGMARQKVELRGRRIEALALKDGTPGERAAAEAAPTSGSELDHALVGSDQVGHDEADPWVELALVPLDLGHHPDGLGSSRRPGRPAASVGGRVAAILEADRDHRHPRALGRELDRQGDGAHERAPLFRPLCAGPATRSGGSGRGSSALAMPVARHRSLPSARSRDHPWPKRSLCPLPLMPQGEGGR
jgi:hypothetical protein